MLLNVLGNNRKYSVICTNWYEITQRCMSAAARFGFSLASVLCQRRFPVTAWKYKTANSRADRPPLSLSHRYKEQMDFQQKICAAAFSCLIGNKEYKCYLLSLSGDT